MFDQKHYVPILKTKAGELNAVESADGKGDRFTPLFEAIRLDQKPNVAVASLKKAWAADSPFFLDAFYIEQDGGLGDTAIEVLANEAREAELNIVPVTGIGRTAAQKDATARAAAQHGLGVCVRLGIEDCEEPRDIDPPCEFLVSSLGLAVSEVHAVIDLGEIATGAVLLRRLVADAINGSTFLQGAATLTIAGCSFPATMSNITAGVVTPIPRVEWTLFNALSQGRIPQRLPTFGDYAATHPTLIEFDPEIMTPAAKIAYTTDLEWLLLKGRSVKGPAGYPQFHQLAANMVARAEYRGPDFSTGDNILQACANRKCGPGNLTTWVTVKTSHHLAQVIDQTANLS